jgi:hypothetical protein
VNVLAVSDFDVLEDSLDIDPVPPLALKVTVGKTGVHCAYNVTEEPKP